MAKRGKVVCVGMAIVDVLVGPVDERVFQRDITKVPVIPYSTGGDAINEATTIARLGHEVQLMASVGADMWGEFILKAGRECGIGMSCVAVTEKYSTTTSIVLFGSGGERVFVANEGTNDHFPRICLDFDAIRAADVVSIGSIFTSDELDALTLEVLQVAKEAGAITTADVICGVEGKGLEQIREVLPLIDYIFPNYDEACVFTGQTEPEKIAQVFLDYGVKTAVIKVGKRGCYVKNEREAMLIPTYQAACVDTTGAGDNFAAGFICALIEGKSLADCARFANATASVSVQFVGTKGVKSRSQVEEMMQRGVLT